MKTFYSNGKLLLTTEYLVLDGAKALAVPTIFGQSIEISHTTNHQIYWKSYDADGSVWYETQILKDDIFNKKNDFINNITNTLIEILYHANLANPKILREQQGFSIETKLSFPRHWGLGTSSTLINNIAQWFQIDAFNLLQKAFGGSGYDIACAQHNTPIIYQLVDGKPIITPISFNPIFKENLYFVYLNQKQNSKTAIENYRSKKGNIQILFNKINELTTTISTTSDFTIFCDALKTHEKEISNVLDIEIVQDLLFSDFEGVIKSLGAWGGDFVLVASATNPTDYFHKKGYSVVMTFAEMVL